jgi:conserved hypothetical integral membrane protein TIGR02185
MDNKLKAKDFITLGIYNVLFVIVMLIAGITNLTPYTYLFYPFTGALFSGFIFLLAVAKVPKKGCIVLMSLVMIIYLAATGVQGMISAASILIFAIIAEIILGSDRKNSKRIMIAYVVFTCWMSVGGEFRMFVFPDSYFAEALQSGLDPSYVEILRGMSSWGWWLISIAAGLVGAFLGILLAKALMKKHLQRAGIV